MKNQLAVAAVCLTTIFAVSCSIEKKSIEKKPNALSCTYEGKNFIKPDSPTYPSGEFIFRLNKNENTITKITDKDVETLPYQSTNDIILFSNVSQYSGMFGSVVATYQIDRKTLAFDIQKKDGRFVYEISSGSCKQIHLDESENKI